MISALIKYLKVNEIDTSIIHPYSHRYVLNDLKLLSQVKDAIIAIAKTVINLIVSSVGRSTG